MCKIGGVSKLCKFQATKTVISITLFNYRVDRAAENGFIFLRPHFTSTAQLMCAIYHCVLKNFAERLFF